MSSSYETSSEAEESVGSLLHRVLGTRSKQLMVAIIVGSLGAVTLSQGVVFLLESRLTELREFHSPALDGIQDIRSELTEAVEESFAFVVSGERGEKDDFFSWTERFPASAAQFRQIARLDLPEEAGERAIFEKIVTLQRSLVMNAHAMFDEYESSGTVASATFSDYEHVVDEIVETLDELVAIERSEVGEMLD